MKYAISILEKEKGLLMLALSGWQSNNQNEYKSAYEQRKQRLYEIVTAIEVLEYIHEHPEIYSK
jgi:hypothetical protein